jgi:hypothetical protein
MQAERQELGWISSGLRYFIFSTGTVPPPPYVFMALYLIKLGDRLI